MPTPLPKVTLLHELPPPDAPPGSVGPPRSHTYRDPGYAVKDELSAAYAEHGDSHGPALRVLAATVGLCTRLGGESRIDYVKAGCSPLRYGGAFLDWYRAQPGGATPEAASALIDAGALLLRHIRDDLFPREAEVSAALGKSGGSEAPLTDSPSKSPSSTDTAIPGGSGS